MNNWEHVEEAKAFLIEDIENVLGDFTRVYGDDVWVDDFVSDLRALRDPHDRMRAYFDMYTAGEQIISGEILSLQDGKQAWKSSLKRMLASGGGLLEELVGKKIGEITLDNDRLRDVPFVHPEERFSGNNWRAGVTRRLLAGMRESGFLDVGHVQGMLDSYERMQEKMEHVKAAEQGYDLGLARKALNQEIGEIFSNKVTSRTLRTGLWS